MTGETHENVNDIDTQTPMTPISSDSDSGFGSNFQLPDNILKNLTPSKPRSTATMAVPISPTSPNDDIHQQRRQWHLRAKTNKIRHRMEQVTKKLLVNKKLQNQAQRKRIKRLNHCLKSASQRREQHLKVIRERAKSLQSKIMSAADAPDIDDDIDSDIETPDDLHRCHRTLISGFEMWYPVNKILLLQRHIRQYLFRSRRQMVQESNFLENYHKMSMNECTKTLQSDGEEKCALETLFRLLVPGCEMSHIRVFLYAFIMTSDVNDSIRLEKHPGCNANGSDPRTNIMNNFIWLLLYKQSHVMIRHFATFVHDDGCEDCAHSDKVAKFTEAWRGFHSLFVLYRSLHFHNLQQILDQSVAVAQRHVEIITDDDHIKSIRDNLVNEKRLMGYYRQLLNRQEFDFSDEWLEQITNAASVVHVPEMFHYRLLTNVMVFEDNRYYVPPILTNEHWRRFWFMKYCGIGSEMAERAQAPKLMRSGVSNIGRGNGDHGRETFVGIDEICEMLQIPTVCETFETLQKMSLTDFHKELAKLVTNDLAVLARYCVVFKQGKAQAREFIPVVESLAGKWVLKEVTFDEYLCECLREGAAFARITNHTTLAPPLEAAYALWEARCAHPDRAASTEMHGIIANLCEFKTLVMNLWTRRCSFTSYNSFKAFENSYLFVKNRATLRFAVYTYSPYLRFPLFYEYLRRMGYQFHAAKVASMFGASASLPAVCGGDGEDTTRKRCDEYFATLFTRAIMEGQFYDHELSGSYHDDFRALHERAAAVVASALATHLATAYLTGNRGALGSVRVEINPGTAFDRLLQGDSITAVVSEDLSLHGYIRTSQPTIARILVSKLTCLINMDPQLGQFVAMLHSSFSFGAATVLELILDIRHTVRYVTTTYGPLLHWVYRDLGEPDISCSL